LTTSTQSFAPEALSPGVSSGTLADDETVPGTGIQPPVLGSYQRARPPACILDKSTAKLRDPLPVGGM
jgi:hypothetical protein